MFRGALRNRGLQALVAASQRSVAAVVANTEVTAGHALARQAIVPASVRSFHASNLFCGGGGALTPADIEHATGLELAELKGRLEGKDIFLDNDSKWMNAPKGTLEAPCEVTSMYDERIVGVPDEDDDSCICWGVITLKDNSSTGEGMVPKLIGDEYFTLRKIPGGPSHDDH